MPKPLRARAIALADALGPLVNDAEQLAHDLDEAGVALAYKYRAAPRMLAQVSDNYRDVVKEDALP